MPSKKDMDAMISAVTAFAEDPDEEEVKKLAKAFTEMKASRVAYQKIRCFITRAEDRCRVL